MLPSDPPNKYDLIMETANLPPETRALIRRASFNSKNQSVDGFIYYDRENAIPDGTPVIIYNIKNVTGEDNDIYHTSKSAYLVEVVTHG